MLRITILFLKTRQCASIQWSHSAGDPGGCHLPGHVDKGIQHQRDPGEETGVVEEEEREEGKKGSSKKPSYLGVWVDHTSVEGCICNDTRVHSHQTTHNQ